MGRSRARHRGTGASPDDGGPRSRRGRIAGRRSQRRCRRRGARGQKAPRRGQAERVPGIDRQEKSRRGGLWCAECLCRHEEPVCTARNDAAERHETRESKDPGCAIERHAVFRDRARPRRRCRRHHRAAGGCQTGPGACRLSRSAGQLDRPRPDAESRRLFQRAGHRARRFGDDRDSFKGAFAADGGRHY